jgi:hypothetical protein
VPIFSSLIFGAVRWAARKGLRGEREDFSMEPEPPKPTNAGKRMAARKLEAGRTGVRRETYAYWYLRRKGYVFVARNYIPRGAKGEIDLIGYDGKTLAFVEVRTRTERRHDCAAGIERHDGQAARGGADGAAVSWGEACRAIALAGSMCWQSITGRGCRRR